jgi:hypothetical protein
MTPINPSRRRFLQLAVTGASVLSLSGMLEATAGVPHLTSDDPTAKSLGYVEDAAKIDPTKEAAYKKASHCASCALYQTAQAQGGYAPCAAFPGKAVNAKGWCRAYAAKA